MHPDALNDKSASGDGRRGRTTGPRASSAEVEKVLENVRRSGGLGRIPRKARSREILLGALCAGMQRRRAYSEKQLNELLGTLLANLNARVDHVTCRRVLVDHGFLKRDRTGAVYLLNTPRLEIALSPEGIEAARGFVEKGTGH